MTDSKPSPKHVLLLFSETREGIEEGIIRILRILGILSFVVMVGFPFYWMVVSSLKSLQELLLHPDYLVLDIGHLDFTAYGEVLFGQGFVQYTNSVYVAVLTVLLSLSLATLGGYAVTRLYFRGQALMSLSILVIYMFPAIVLVIPLYVVFSWRGLRDSIHVLILVYLAQTLPVALYMLRSYFQNRPSCTMRSWCAGWRAANGQGICRVATCGRWAASGYGVPFSATTPGAGRPFRHMPFRPLPGPSGGKWSWHTASRPTN